MFVQWVDGLKDESIKKEVISIDGKCIRGSKDSFHGQSPIHMVSAWASANQLVLGQLMVDEKSNEITAIPILLDIEGSIVTIDAIGTQTHIAKRIIKNNVDYIQRLDGMTNISSVFLNKFKCVDPGVLLFPNPYLVAIGSAFYLLFCALFSDKVFIFI